MLWLAGETVKLRLTEGAAANTELPAWLATTVQVPPATRVRLLPLTVQTADVLLLKLTGRPELAVATRLLGAWPNTRPLGAVKAIVCAVLPTAETVIVRVLV